MRMQVDVRPVSSAMKIMADEVGKGGMVVEM